MSCLNEAMPSNAMSLLPDSDGPLHFQHIHVSSSEPFDLKKGPVMIRVNSKIIVTCRLIIIRTSIAHECLKETLAWTLFSGGIAT